jgi:hypothetical protein
VQEGPDDPLGLGVAPLDRGHVARATRRRRRRRRGVTVGSHQ